MANDSRNEETLQGELLPTHRAAGSGEGTPSVSLASVSVTSVSAQEVLSQTGTVTILLQG